MWNTNHSAGVNISINCDPAALHAFITYSSSHQWMPLLLCRFGTLNERNLHISMHRTICYRLVCRTCNGIDPFIASSAFRSINSQQFRKLLIKLSPNDILHTSQQPTHCQGYRNRWMRTQEVRTMYLDRSSAIRSRDCNQYADYAVNHGCWSASCSCEFKHLHECRINGRNLSSECRQWDRRHLFLLNIFHATTVHTGPHTPAMILRPKILYTVWFKFNWILNWRDSGAVHRGTRTSQVKAPQERQPAVQVTVLLAVSVSPFKFTPCAHGSLPYISLQSTSCLQQQQCPEHFTSTIRQARQTKYEFIFSAKISFFRVCAAIAVIFSHWLRDAIATVQHSGVQRPHTFPSLTLASPYTFGRHSCSRSQNQSHRRAGNKVQWMR